MKKYNYHEYINTWLKLVETGKVYTSKEIKQLCGLVRTTLDSNTTIFDSKIVEDYVRLTEKYFFKLMPDQKFYASLILGLKNKSDNMLTFPQIFILAGRGWGKNGFISSLSFFLTSKNYGINKYDIHIVATSEEQAKTSFEEVYDVIYDMGEKGKRLYDYNLTKIQNKKTRSKILFKTSNAKTKDGGRPGCVIFDEVHAYESYENIKVFTGGLGKVPHARRIYITTDGEVRDGVLDDYKERSRQILTGERKHDGFLPIVMKLDRIQEISTFKFWEKANPRINYSPDLKKEIEDEYKEMLSNESLKEAFITKRMNIPYVSKIKTVCEWEDLIRACQSHEWIDLKQKTCVGSIDFADLRDFASAGLRWKVGGKTYFKQHSWVHEKSLQLAEYNIDIDECVRQGWLTVVKSIDYPTIQPKLLADWFLEQAQRGYFITKIKADSFRLSAIKDEFTKYGVPEVEEVRSGSISHNKVAPIIDLMFAEDKIVFEDDKLLRWFFWNVKREMDKKGNISYLKIEPKRRKTDGFFCFLHSLINDELVENNEALFIDVMTY